MVTSQKQNLKGFRDFIGIEAKKRTWLVGVFRQVFESYGFEPLETPALEYEDLLLGKYGDEANKLIYGFEDRGGRRVALRYDQTVPMTRVVSQYRNELVFPYKRYQIQPVWRADKPQKGRYREFTQCDIDIIDAVEPVADAQIIATVATVFAKLQIGCKIVVNDREQLITTIKSVGISDDQLYPIIQTIDKLDKKSSDEVIQELRDRGLSSEKCNELFQKLKASKPSSKLLSILDIAKTLGVADSMIQYSPTLARGLDYYTGLIFEITIPEYKSGSVGGGGRYDKLMGSMTGLELPAIGMAFGFDRLLDAIAQLDKFPASIYTPTQILVTIFGKEYVQYSASICQLLQKNNIAVELYADSRKKIEGQIKYAIAKNIPYVIIAGSDEQQNRTVKLKNLQTREQSTVSIVDIIDTVRKIK